MIPLAGLWLTLVARPSAGASPSFSVTARSEAFSPSSMTVDAGDEVTITFSVPADDSYCCGLQVKAPGAFDTGAIGRGQSKTVTFTAAKAFTFTSYWPGTSVRKADGTVTVMSSMTNTNANANVNANANLNSNTNTNLNTNTNTNTSTTKRCRIKGDVQRLSSRKIRKRYYVPSHRLYKKIVIRKSQGDRYFCTERGARSLGFVKAR